MGNYQVRFGGGPTEKGRKLPRRRPTLLGRYVKKGSRAVYILVPWVVKKQEDKQDDGVQQSVA